jgi:2-amino-4-hydroxy-6-hydroxymethyldihydropteridine diphosphokinase
MHQAVLLIGGNLDDRVQLIRRAHLLLSDFGQIVSASNLYETQAWGNVSEGNFLNQALVLKTTKSPLALLEATQEIEHQLGRSREVHWGNRTMDIDMIYFDDLVYQDEKLTLPHPLLAERNFVLIPLVEILPDFVHPVFHLTNRELLRQCVDQNKVEQYWPDNTDG